MKSHEKTPTKMVALMFFANLIQAMAFAASFGYLPKLLNNFGISWKNVGFYQGLITAEYSVVVSISSLVFTKIFSKINKKTVFVFANIIQAFSFVLLAFSTNIYLLITGIFLMSIPAVIRIIIEVLVYEMSSEDTSAQLANYAITTPWNAGFFLGQALGGVLSFPAEQYPKLFSENYWLKEYQILLPNALFSLLNFCVAFLSYLIIPKSGKSIDKGEITCEDRTFNESTNLIMSESKNDDQLDDSMKLLQLLKCKNARLIVLIMILFSTVSNGLVTAFSIYSMTPRSTGGLGYSPYKSGLIVLISGPFVALIDLLVIGRSVKKVGPKIGLTFYSLLLLLGVSMTPSIKILPKHWDYSFYILIDIINGICSSGIEVALFSIKANVVSSCHIDMLIAIQECCSVLAEAIGHLIAGSVFAWSLNNDKIIHKDGIGFPLDHAFVFYVLGGTMLFCVVLETLFEDNVHKRKNDI